MRHIKYHSKLNEISPGRDIGYIDGKAKRGKAAEFKSAREMHALLRDYTYHLIGLGNAFRGIARAHGKHTGCNWRTFRGCVGTELQSIMEKTYTTNPYDVDAILELERAIETLVESLKAVSRE